MRKQRKLPIVANSESKCKVLRKNRLIRNQEFRQKLNQCFNI